MTATAQQAIKIFEGLNKHDQDFMLHTMKRLSKTREKELEERKQAFYNSPESLEALEEAKRLMNDPNAKSFRNTAELFEDCLNGDDDDE
ncbi:MAG: hypothetical protein FWB96_07730 [Defluviitaleaceae bacterium]|nr:hypothetical protein [Defluviitaleaceae bacterium]MCL2262878.1 hypothetical protein [Defluviitaleaceae bacterium]